MTTQTQSGGISKKNWPTVLWLVLYLVIYHFLLPGLHSPPLKSLVLLANAGASPTVHRGETASYMASTTGSPPSSIVDKNTEYTYPRYKTSSCALNIVRKSTLVPASLCTNMILAVSTDSCWSTRDRQYTSLLSGKENCILIEPFLLETGVHVWKRSLRLKQPVGCTGPSYHQRQASSTLELPAGATAPASAGQLWGRLRR